MPRHVSLYAAINNRTVDPQLSRPQVSDGSNYLDWVLTVQLESFLVCVLLVFILKEVLYINVWASVIGTFQLSERTQVLMSLDKQGSTVFCIIVTAKFMCSHFMNVQTNRQVQ